MEHQIELQREMLVPRFPGPSTESARTLFSGDHRINWVRELG